MIYVDRVNGFVATHRFGITNFVWIYSELTSCRVKRVERPLAAHPEGSGSVLGNIEVLLLTTGLVLLVCNETISLRVKSIKSVPRCNPHCTAMIEEQPAHDVVAQT